MTIVYGPSHGNVFEQETSLRMQWITVYHPASGYPLTSVFGAHAVLQTSQAASSAVQEPVGSNQVASMVAPDLTKCNPGEQAVIVALQARSNYPDSQDFLQAVQQRLPGLRT